MFKFTQPNVTWCGGGEKGELKITPKSIKFYLNWSFKRLMCLICYWCFLQTYSNNKKKRYFHQVASTMKQRGSCFFKCCYSIWEWRNVRRKFDLIEVAHTFDYSKSTIGCYSITLVLTTHIALNCKLCIARYVILN